MATTRIPRVITAATANASKAEVFRPIVLVELEFDGPEYLRMNSSSVEFTWDSRTWLGVGNFGSISPIKEGASLESHGLELTLSGIPTEHISMALSENIQGRPARVYLALLDEDFTVIVDPVTLGPWRMDTMSISLGEEATVILRCESLMADWKRPKVRRYTHEEQIRKYPGDRGLEYVSRMASLEFNWGLESDKVPSGMWKPQ